jgi:hypothetical protein
MCKTLSWPHHGIFEFVNLIQPHPFLLKCLYQPLTCAYWLYLCYSKKHTVYSWCVIKCIMHIGNKQWRIDRIMNTTNKIHQSSFVTHIFRSGHPSHGGKLFSTDDSMHIFTIMPCVFTFIFVLCVKIKVYHSYTFGSFCFAYCQCA